MIDKEMIAEKINDKKHDYYRIAISFCNNKDDSMDAIADMTLIALKKYSTLKDPNAFFYWSTKILINICKKKLRNNKSYDYLDDVDLGIEEFDNYQEILIDLKKALLSINSQNREVVILKSVLGYSFKQCASILNIPLRTSQSRYNLGMKKLRERLGESYYEEN